MSTGILAIWYDCKPGKEGTFEDWYQHEHLPERLGVPGFRRGRRWQTVSGAPSMFTVYETDDPGVLTSPPYIERLNNPTPWSKRIMTEAFSDMSRTVCRLTARHGRMRGAWAAALRLTAPPDATVDAALAELAQSPGVARAEAWTSVGDSTETAESRLRGGDQQIAACLFVETLREDDARDALDTLSAKYDGKAAIHLLLCELTYEDLAP